MQKSYKIIVTGQVQGVGFRPFVYGSATFHNLAGTVSNNKDGVLIFISGDKKDCLNFYHSLIQNPPPVSKIEQHSMTEIEKQVFMDFRIVASSSEGVTSLRLTPDFAICDTCKKEMEDPTNKRFQYPFTTCIHCGPRWAITQRFPFDRETTSLSEFIMCDSCREEYIDPSDRRFHSQTNSCDDCGIHLSLWNNNRQIIEGHSLKVLPKVAELLKEGKIIAIKNTSGYLLCCHAERPETVIRLRELKKRPKKPFAVLYPSLKKLQSELPLTKREIDSFTSPERPIIIISLQDYKGKMALSQVAPGLHQLGVMLPYTGILELLGKELEFPIVATSGNIHGSPIISDTEEAFEKLATVADYFVHHTLSIEHPQDDSVVKYSFKNEIQVLFRRSRGYAPNIFIKPQRTNQKILALGADLKSTISLSPNENMYLSQYLGNLENYEVYERFTQETNAFLNLFEATPNVLLIDQHPSYLSSLFGQELADNLGLTPIPIQHHKAHFASVLGEHQLFGCAEKILGIVWDGVGFGEDGQIWGGEFFDYHSGTMERIGHFEYFDWLAGDKMSKEPRLSLLSLSENPINFANKFTDVELEIFQNLKRKSALKTSSVGRLFDAVASLLDLCDYNSYEGEASILLENSISNYDLDDCKSYFPANFTNFMPTKAVISEIESDLVNEVSKEKIIANFLYSLAKLCLQFAAKNGYESLCFSGGVFQNTTLVDMITDLNTEGFQLYFNKELSPNDENISFGQTMYFLNCHSA